MNAQAGPQELLDAALDYAARGWPVHPLNGKAPCSPHGFKDATCDPETIRQWWAWWPTANIGLRTGVTFDVLDIDHPDLTEGTADMPPLVMPGGPVAITGSGGLHFYVKATGHASRTKFTKYCDWLGADHCVVAPPSVHPATGKPYRWEPGPDVPLQPAPPELLALIAPKPKPSVPAPQRREIRHASGKQWNPAGLIGEVASAAEGQRNTRLHWAARKVATDHRNGKAGHAEALHALEKLSVAAMRAGLTEREVSATIRSAWRGVAP